MGGLLQHVQRNGFLQLALAGDQVRQGLAADVLHGNEAHAETGWRGDLAVVIGGHHVGGVDAFCSQCFVAEAGEELLVAGELRAQDFQRHLALIDHIVCQPHGGHAAVADDPLQLVVIADKLL